MSLPNNDKFVYNKIFKQQKMYQYKKYMYITLQNNRHL